MDSDVEVVDKERVMEGSSVIQIGGGIGNGIKSERPL